MYNGFDQYGFPDPRDIYGEYEWQHPSWMPPYYQNSRARGEVLPVYTTWAQLKFIRDRNRRLCQENEFAICATENRKNYVVGDGFTYRAVCDDEGLSRDAQRVIDAFVEHNELADIEAECINRADSDGEAFLRFFKRSSGILDIRFVEPEHVRDPLGDSFGPEHSFGVRTDPRDVESVHGFWVVDDPFNNGSAVSLVPADEILHIRFNVSRTAKRGLPTFYPIENNLRRAEDLLCSMSAMAKTRAKIAMIRKFTQSPRGAVERLRDELKDAEVTEPITGKVHTLERIRPGTILNASGGLEYEFPHAQTDAASFVEVLQAELRGCAARLVMPEWMFTVDASNANYSSSLIAEAPAVKAFRRLQRLLARRFGESRYGGRVSAVWRQLRHAVSLGILPPDTARRVDVQVEAPTLEVRDKDKEATVNKTYVDMRIKSPQTIAQELGLDYEQEQANFRESDALNPQPEPAMQEEPVAESWDESQHDRADDGKFGSGKGDAASEPTSRVDRLRAAREQYRALRKQHYTDAQGEVAQHRESEKKAESSLRTASDNIPYMAESADKASAAFGQAWNKLDEALGQYDAADSYSNRFALFGEMRAAARESLTRLEKVEPGNAEDRMTAEEIESAKSGLTTVIQHADAARQAIRSQVAARREMRDVKTLRESHVAEEFRESDHPRDKAGKFLATGELEAASRDPDKLAELRDRVKPEDAEKLEKAVKDHTTKDAAHNDASDRTMRASLQRHIERLKREGRTAFDKEQLAKKETQLAAIEKRLGVTPAAPEKIGSGNTGDVTRHGDEVHKSATLKTGAASAEGKAYELLAGVPGIAPGRQEGGSIVTPHYKNVVSVDAVPENRRTSMGPVVRKNLDRIVSAVVGMSQRGVSYNDPLQFGFDGTNAAHLIDLSNASLGVNPDEALRDNVGQLDTFLRQFGNERAADSITRSVTTLLDMKAHLGDGVDADFLDPHTAEHAAKLASQLDGKPPQFAYYTGNARHVGVKGVAQTEPAAGAKVVLSTSPISDADIKTWELTPVLHGAGDTPKVDTPKVDTPKQETPDHPAGTPVTWLTRNPNGTHRELKGTVTDEPLTPHGDAKLDAQRAAALTAGTHVAVKLPNGRVGVVAKDQIGAKHPGRVDVPAKAETPKQETPKQETLPPSRERGDLHSALTDSVNGMGLGVRLHKDKRGLVSGASAYDLQTNADVVTLNARDGWRRSQRPGDTERHTAASDALAGAMSQHFAAKLAALRAETNPPASNIGTTADLPAGLADKFKAQGLRVVAPSAPAPRVVDPDHETLKRWENHAAEVERRIARTRLENSPRSDVKDGLMMDEDMLKDFRERIASLRAKMSPPITPPAPRSPIHNVMSAMERSQGGPGEPTHFPRARK